MDPEDKNTILIVSDVPEQLDQMNVLLRQAGYRVLPTNDEREAYELARRSRPSLVISHILTPQTNGSELRRLMRQNAELRAVPMLLVSALPEDSAGMTESLRTGTDDYLQAPYNSLLLIAKVTRLVERERIEAHYRNIVEQASDIIYEHDLEGRLTRINAAGRLFLGGSREELLGTHFGQAFGLSDPEAQVKATIDRLRQAGARRDQIEARDARGRQRCLDISLMLICNRSGEAMGVRGLARDITERKQVEETLRRQALIFANLSDGIIITDLERRITDCNPAAERMFGYAKEEMLGRTTEILHRPGEADALREAILEGIARDGRWFGEINFVRKDGTEGVCETNVIPLNDEHGKQIARIGVNRDITERKRGEEALRQAEARAIIEYEQLLDRLATLAQAFGMARDLTTIFRALREFSIASVPCHNILISLYDAERDVRRPVYAWSEGAEVDVSALPALPMTDSPHQRAMLAGKVIITDDQQVATIDQLTSDRRLETEPRQPSSLLIAPMVARGRTLGMTEVQCAQSAAFKNEHATAMRLASNLVAVAIENVQLFQRERERAEQEAESDKMRSLGQLAAGVAHDFNNSLAAILGRTQLLLRSVTDEKQRRSLHVIETASLDAAETVRRIQTFARRMPTGHLSPVSIAKLIRDAIQLTRTRWEDDARAHGLHYDIHFTSALEGADHILINPSEVREVFVNLILNALDAMPSGGEIIFQEDQSDDGFITVEVKDTGVGIPSALKDRIFEPFFTTKGTQGSGLGLAISYGIIQRHGGTIDVESEVGQGTTFILRFPRTQQTPARSAKKKKLNLPRRRVLVVDDEDMVRNVLAELLKELQQDVTAVSSGGEALAALAVGRYDLMITDLSMPGMDGLTLAAHARQQAPHMMIVLATGYGQNLPDHLIDRSLINMVINKPFHLADIEAFLWGLHGKDEERGVKA